MRNISKSLLFLALTLLPKLALAAGTAAPSIGSFDLFGFPLSAAENNLGTRASALGQALAATFPKEFKAENFKENNYSGHCFNSGPDQYKLSWRDSETEGFNFKVEKLKDQKGCVSPFSEGQSFKSSSFNAAQFSPISHFNSGLQLGVSTPAQIQQALGKPAYSSSGKLIYILKRDKEKEKGCGANPGQGDFDAIDVEFDFNDGTLQSVMMSNNIAGEC